MDSTGRPGDAFSSQEGSAQSICGSISPERLLPDALLRHASLTSGVRAHDTLPSKIYLTSSRLIKYIED